MGHAGETMSELYDKVKENVAVRKEWAEKCGIGFELPSGRSIFAILFSAARTWLTSR
jgi:hypothetical protein